MTENKAVGKITLLIHTRGRKKTTINFNSLHLNVKFDFIHSIHIHLKATTGQTWWI